jgi:hypothetical protein
VIELDKPNVLTEPEILVEAEVVAKKTTYIPPGQSGSIVEVKTRYDNFIGGKWVVPVGGHYTVNLSPATAHPICEVPQSTPEDSRLRRGNLAHRGGRTHELEEPKSLGAVAHQ